MNKSLSSKVLIMEKSLTDERRLRRENERKRLQNRQGEGSLPGDYPINGPSNNYPLNGNGEDGKARW